MSKLMLMAGLVLGSLAGVSGAGQQSEPSRPIQVEAAYAGFGYQDHGSFEYFTDAIPTRTYWRGQGYAANIVRMRNGRYTVRVFDK